MHLNNLPSRASKEISQLKRIVMPWLKRLRMDGWVVDAYTYSGVHLPTDVHKDRPPAMMRHARGEKDYVQLHVAMGHQDIERIVVHELLHAKFSKIDGWSYGMVGGDEDSDSFRGYNDMVEDVVRDMTAAILNEEPENNTGEAMSQD